MKRETYKKLIELANEEIKAHREWDALLKKFSVFSTRECDKVYHERVSFLRQHCSDLEDEMRDLIEEDGAPIHC